MLPATLLIGEIRTGDLSDLVLTLSLLCLVRISLRWETPLMEDLVGEGLELTVTVEVGVCGPIRGCRCLAAKDWRVFVGMVIAAF